MPFCVLGRNGPCLATGRSSDIYDCDPQNAKVASQDGKAAVSALRHGLSKWKFLLSNRVHASLMQPQHCHFDESALELKAFIWSAVQQGCW